MTDFIPSPENETKRKKQKQDKKQQQAVGKQIISIYS